MQQWSFSFYLSIPGAAIGSSGLIINAIPFGTDQMLGASSEEISSFIHWFVWDMYTGIASGYFMVNGLHCTSMGDSICSSGHFHFTSVFQICSSGHFHFTHQKIVYSSTTVKPLNKGHVGNGSLVPCREVVLFSVGLFLNKVIKTNT